MPFSELAFTVGAADGARLFQPGMSMIKEHISDGGFIHFPLHFPPHILP